MDLIFSGFVEQKNIENYVLFREKYVNKCRNNSVFRRAVDEMDDFISNPEKYRSNAVARVIKIKSEDEIQRNLGIKIESKNETANEHQTESVTLSDMSKIKMLTNEKSNLVVEVVSLKLENQKTCFELKEKKNELIKIKMENDEKFRELNEQISTLTAKLRIAENESVQLKKSVTEKQAIDKKSIADLTREKNILTARIKQLQSGALLNSPNVQETSDNGGYDSNVFEVDKVIGDKLVDGTLIYRIRWKGYGPKDDTWEKEDNLFCPTILEEYKKSKKK